LEELASAGAIIVCPSNPFISIGPILAVPGIRETIRTAKATAVAVSPIVGGRAVKGPTAAMLAQLGHTVSADGVAAMYADILDAFVLDSWDESLRSRIADLGLAVRTAETLMNTAQARSNLARAVMELVP
jgi:LPPG:FO 2-phospho-L-lactate transferase